MNKILVYFAIKYNGDWDQIYAAINRKEKVDVSEMEKIVDRCECNYITILDSNYPIRLKSIYKPPFVLFYKGDITLLDNAYKTIAVVGSRNCSLYGKKASEQIVKELTDEKFLIISGLAKGIDSIAHLTCLENEGKTIAILGNGIGIYYPDENKVLQETIANKGLILSEYPYSVSANKENFPKRNRIIAGLADGVLVTDCKNKSGSMITVSRALEMGKDIFCIPHPIGVNSGCNTLIKEGAKLVESVKDIAFDL